MQVALRLRQHEGRPSWMLWLVPESHQAQAEGELAAAMDDLDLVRADGFDRPGVWLVTVEGDVDWAALDQHRVRLNRPGPVVLIGSREQVDQLTSLAPNLASWFGANVHGYAEDRHELSEQEVADRLEQLRSWAGISDEEMVARAAAGAMELGPEHGEWLVLLGRGDLLRE